MRSFRFPAFLAIVALAVDCAPGGTLTADQSPSVGGYGAGGAAGAVPAELGPAARAVATPASGGQGSGDSAGPGHQGGSSPALAVQEWGTFTSVQAPDGHTLGGVHHEDEALPAWVHQRNFGDPYNYYFESLPEEPRQQLETPVLYFWTQRPLAVRVDVSFPKGVVGQWYPEATAFEPAIAAMTELARGAMTWDVAVDPAIGRSAFLAVDPDEIWAPSRTVASTPVRWRSHGGYEESEQFIFYRGLGTFDPPVRVVSEPDGYMRVRNDSNDELAAVFLLRATDDAGEVVVLGPLAGGAEHELSPPSPSLDRAEYQEAARAALHAALASSGLHDDVAQAMVDTWTRSWFGNVGLRVLYLAPRGWTDEWLPTKVVPQPDSFVRTLVGRIEVITPGEDAALVALLKASAASGAELDPVSLGRFAEPRLRRALEQLSAPGDVSYATSVLEAAHALP